MQRDCKFDYFAPGEGLKHFCPTGFDFNTCTRFHDTNFFSCSIQSANMIDCICFPDQEMTGFYVDGTFVSSFISSLIKATVFGLEMRNICLNQKPNHQSKAGNLTIDSRLKLH